MHYHESWILAFIKYECIAFFWDFWSSVHQTMDTTRLLHCENDQAHYSTEECLAWEHKMRGGRICIAFLELSQKVENKVKLNPSKWITVLYFENEV